MNIRALPSISQNLDRNVVYGIGLSFALIAIGVLASGSKAAQFVDFASCLIVMGGTFGATLAQFSMTEMRFAWEALKNALLTRHLDPRERISYMVKLGSVVRSDGLLVLDRESRYAEDPFLRLALQATVDGQKPADVKRMLETEMRVSFDRSSKAMHVFETMGSYAPAMGLIGTLIGLIQMLGALDNPAAVGPAMAVALVTTFYGAILANLLFLPLAGKIRNRIQEESLAKAITIEGIECLAKQENPIVIEQRLSSFLPAAA